MKILRLRFKNLNSLTGEWEIDFSDPSFSAEGIFAITGPTGAGKSTILDAICLGLFGRTPRLQTVSASTNDIMSRHTGECMAEVEFSTLKGCFRATWYQNRARKRVDGALQPPRHTLADCVKEVFLTEKSGETARKVEEVTGLNFTRFTRSVLLAQGSFAAFLQARDDDRSDVLEQLTGTEIYSEISRAVFEQTKAENQRLSQLQESLHDLKLLTPEEENQLRDTLQAEVSRADKLRQERDRVQTGLEWYKSLHKLEQELAALETAKTIFASDMESFEPSRQSLELARKALELDAPYTALKSLRESEAELRRQIASGQKTLEKNEQDLGVLSERHTAMQAALVDMRKRHQSEKLVHIQVREQDTRLAEYAKNLQKAGEMLGSQEKAAESAGQKAEQQQQVLENLLRRLLALHGQRLVQQSRAFLEDGIWGIRKTAEELTALLDEQSELAEARSLAQQGLAVSQREFSATEISLKEHNLSIDQQKNGLRILEQQRNHLLDGKDGEVWKEEDESLQRLVSQLEQLLFLGERAVELADEQQRLEQQVDSSKAVMADSAIIIEEIHRNLAGCREQKNALEKESLTLSLAKHRILLAAGEPCPLCGALEHPYTGEKPLQSATKEEKSEPDLLELLQALEDCMAKDEKKLRAEEARQSEAQGRIKILQPQIQSVIERHADLEQKICQKAVSCKLEYRKDNVAFLSDVRQQLASQRKRMEDIRQLLGQAGRLAREIERGSATVLQLQTELDQYQSALKGAELSLAEHKRASAELEGKEQRMQTRLRDGQAQLFDQLVPLYDATPLPDDALDLFCAGLSPELQHHVSGMRTALEQWWQDIKRDIKEQDGKGEADLRSLLSSNLSSEAVKLIMDVLEQMRSGWRIATENWSGCLHALARELPRYEAAILDSEKEHGVLLQQKGEYERLRTEEKRLITERRNLFGDASVDACEIRMADEIAKAEQSMEELLSSLHSLQGTTTAMRRNLEGLLQQLGTLSEKVLEKEQGFATQLKRYEFDSEPHFLSCCLDGESRRKLEETARLLEVRKTELKAQEREKTALIQEKRSQQPSQETEEELQRQVSEFSEKIRQCHESIGGLREKLDHNQAVQRQKSDRLQSIFAQQEELGKWKTLNDLIGSHDGKKFRQFAQGLTFEAVVVEANKVLARLSDRYTLLRDRQNPLELNVCDSDQAGEIRSTRNLSGGESFIVSLALALGLSSMASRTVRLDSLFLDEGFGALDEDTLDVALDVLSSLPDDGKVIGIISHVTSLKERIRKNIQVTPQSGGRSRLEEGAGVRRVKEQA